VRYDFSKDTMVYATYAVGFKSGGFNIGGLQPPFNPEKLYDYEMGIKSQFLERRIRANIAAFYYDYKNLQVNIVDNTHFVTTNAAGAEIYGVESELTAMPTEDVKATVNLSWLHARYTNYTAEDPGRPELGVQNFAGSQLAFAPNYKATAELGYTVHPRVGDLTFRGEISWTSKTYFSAFDSPVVAQSAYAVGNVYVDYARADSGWSGSLYVKNIADKYYLLYATYDTAFEGFPVAGVAGPPRTVGLSISKRF
jgi:iron complex outermembrane recepter protein